MTNNRSSLVALVALSSHTQILLTLTVTRTMTRTVTVTRTVTETMTVTVTVTRTETNIFHRKIYNPRPSTYLPLLVYRRQFFLCFLHALKRVFLMRKKFFVTPVNTFFSITLNL